MIITIIFHLTIYPYLFQIPTSQPKLYQAKAKPVSDLAWPWRYADFCTCRPAQSNAI